MKSKLLGIILLAMAVVIFAIVVYRNNPKRQVPIVFAPRTMLAGLWNSYTLNILEEGTFRTLDRERDFITTSEGQSYTMLRAVWMDDKDIFDKSWKWTNDILKRKEDNLFSWLFGKRTDGTYAVIEEQGGYNTASDADTDIALALIFAYNRWGDKAHLDAATAIIKDIWDKEVVTIEGKPYLAANNLEKNSGNDWIIVNPSYFAPYAYRIFSVIDPEHPWLEVVDTSYAVIKQSTTLPLDKSRGVLPPDWVRINRTNGEISAPTTGGLGTNYSFDALRIPLRIAFDYVWYNEPRAKEALETMHFLGDEWRTNKKINAGYTHDGTPTVSFESPAMYGGSIGYFIATDEKTAKEIYKNKLESLYNPDLDTWKEPQSYYNDNIVWFAIGLYNNALPNLAENLSIPNPQP
jgi:endoglucanase